MDRISELEKQLEQEREKVKGLHEITKVICTHCCEPMEIPSKAVLQTQLTQLQALVRALPNIEGEIMVSESLVLAEDPDMCSDMSDKREAEAYAALLRYRATLDATTPARFTKEELTKWWHAQCPQCGWDGLSRDCAGGEPIADTGDYADPICPMCDQTGRCVVVDDYVAAKGGDGE